jgi:hypothetical protein
MLYALLLIGQSTLGQTEGHSPKAVNWLVGNWESVSEGLVVNESWEVLNDSTLVGTSSTLKDGTVVFSEKLAIEFRNRTYRYVADLGFKIATFSVQAIADNSISFVDPENDFPSRIIYVRADKELTITLEGSGQMESISFKLK